MRNFAVVVIGIAGVIALLDVAGALVFNGSVNVPLVLILVVALAAVVHLVGQRPQRVMDPEDVITLLRLRVHAAALARHTQVLDKLQLLGDR